MLNRPCYSKGRQYSFLEPLGSLHTPFVGGQDCRTTSIFARTWDVDLRTPTLSTSLLYLEISYHLCELVYCRPSRHSFHHICRRPRAHVSSSSFFRTLGGSHNFHVSTWESLVPTNPTIFSIHLHFLPFYPFTSCSPKYVVKFRVVYSLVSVDREAEPPGVWTGRI